MFASIHTVLWLVLALEPVSKVGTIYLGRLPHGIAFHQNMAYVTVSGEQKIVMIDLDKLEVVGKRALSFAPYDLAPGVDGELWRVSEHLGDEIYTLNMTDNKEAVGSVVGDRPTLFFPRSSNGIVYFTAAFGNELTVYDAYAGRVLSHIPVGHFPQPGDVTRDGKRAFVPNRTDGTVSVVDLENDKVVQVVEVGKEPSGGALTPDDSLFLVACSGSEEVVYLDTKTLRVTTRIQKDVDPRPISVAVSEDGRYGLVNTWRETIAVLDIKAQKVVQRLWAGKKPLLVRFYQGRAYVVNQASGNLSVLTVDAP